MKILITGAAGFIGSNLAHKLLEEGHQVVGIDNFITGSRKNIEELSSVQNFSFLEADITSLTPAEKISLTVIDQVYHLACPTGVPNLGPLAEEMLLTCSSGTKNILDVALTNKANLVFTSSSEVYGDPETFPQEESYTGNVDPTGLRSPYEEGKRFSEALTVMYARKHGLNAKIVRVFNTYGPRMSDKDTRVIPNFIRQITKGDALTLHGEGDQRRTFCYVDDLVSGLKIIMEKGKVGEVYNLGGDEEITVKDLAGLIAAVREKELKLQYEQRPAHDHQARLPELSRIKELGWSPKINLRDGLTLTLKLSEPAKI